MNHSENYGREGDTNDPGIEAVRLRQIKNMLATLLISRGVPMILGGDEFRRTQQGNNNAYCQDNEVSWYNWALLNRNYEVFRFLREMIAFRKRHRVLRTQEFYTSQDILWFSPGGRPPHWRKAGRTLGWLIRPQQFPEASQSQALCALFNAEISEVTFKLPSPSGGERWHLAVDTARPSPHDIHEAGREESLIWPDSYRMQPRSMVILISR